MHKRKKIVIVGNGFGGVYTLLNLHKYFKDKKNLEVVLIGDKNHFLFTPLLHEVATGGVHVSNVTEPIRKIFGCCITKFHLGKVEMVNTNQKYLEVAIEKENLGLRVDYDYLVLAHGSKTNYYDIPGADKYTLSLKTLNNAIAIKNHCIEMLEKASEEHDEEKRKKMLHFIVVGGGATGVELVAEITEFVRDTFAYYYSRRIMRDVKITLVHGGDELLPQFKHKLRKKAEKILINLGINVMLNKKVTEVKMGELIFSDNTNLIGENIFWMAGITPNEMHFDIEPARLKDGRIITDHYLRMQGHEDIFVIGDAGAFEISENIFAPQLAQIAVRQAKQVAKNIIYLTHGQKIKEYKYRNLGSLISIGKWSAVGEIGGISFSGRLAWFMWRMVYLTKVISGRKRFVTFVDWTINYFFPRDISQI